MFNTMPLLNQLYMLPLVFKQMRGEGWVVPQINPFFAPIPIIFPAAKSINLKTKLSTPLSHFIHSFTLERRISDTKARVILLSMWLAKPIDRIIQAIVNPIFRLIDPCLWASRSKDDYKILKWTAAVIATPFSFALGLIESIGFIANATFQLFIPYQTIYAVAKGKESSREFFDLTSHLLSKRLKKIENCNDDFKVSATPILNKLIAICDEREKPKTKYEKIIESSKANRNQFDKVVHIAHKFVSYVPPLWPINMALCLRPRILFPGLRRLAVC